MYIVTAIAFLNRTRGTHSLPLSRLAVEIWEWCIKRNFTIHAEHSRSAEYQSGLAITPCSRLQRLETGQRNLSPPGEQTRPIHNWPLCIQNQHTTSNLLQLATRPKGNGSKCSFYTMEGTESLHVPSIHSNTLLSKQAMRRGSISTIDSISVG